MAKIKQGILGALSGKIGGVVGAVWMGIAYIRTMPASVANPNTASQQIQRGKFASCVSVARLLLSDLIQTYWDPFARYMSGYNAFIKQNIDAFATAGFTVFADFWSARGTLMGFAGPAVSASEASSIISITYTDNSGQGDALADDYIHGVVYNETQDYWVFYTAFESRMDTTAEFNDTNMVENDVLHVYPFYSRGDISKVSDSVYLTTTVAA